MSGWLRNIKSSLIFTAADGFDKSILPLTFVYDLNADNTAWIIFLAHKHGANIHLF